ncbi:MAG: His/Gly/Thr/Pro-type tRNA ligase C-terminal domain-containing protein, partial [Myxococcota bacterium]|nr:His/Gly/Thr/Pro-type tRNA ligase C-terminal domain-containing protein [Myxococcota bacterium]
PILINQWANVVRWEMRTRPFLRTAEFLWQEGHTAHATRQEAFEEAERMLQVYRDFCHEFLAIPVVPGIKTANERFAGAEETYTIEGMMQNGWALQAGTSHFLGQNFARAFDVTFQNSEGNRDFVWATSWGVSTRLVGALIMSHSDDTGLVLPPKVAPVQVVIVPIYRKEHERAEVMDFARAVQQALGAQFRVELDSRDHLKPGAKYFEWERKGVPLRMEVGPRDVQKQSVFCKRRTGGDKFGLPLEGLADATRKILDEIQSQMLQQATDFRDSRTSRVETYEQMKSLLSEKPGFFLVPWKDDPANEAAIKDDCKATIRCYPMEGQLEAHGRSCFYSGEPATHMALFARAY